MKLRSRKHVLGDCVRDFYLTMEQGTGHLVYRSVNGRLGRRSALFSPISECLGKDETQTSSSANSYYADIATSNITFGELNEEFAMSVTAHGFARIALTKKHRIRQIFWMIFVICAVLGFLYHVSFLLGNYFDYPVSTSTEEIHAAELDFPAITLCNLNILKKTKFEAYLKDTIKRQEEQEAQTSEMPDFLATTSAAGLKGNDELDCFKTTGEIVNRSRTMDLSDMWINLVTTKKQLKDFGHQAADMIVQCTYSSKDCFNSSSSIVQNTPYESPRYGLCHSLTLNTEERKTVKSGAGMGLLLTINIERNEYLDIVSGEYGARMVVHAVGSRPTLDTGGMILLPGSKTYIAVKMRQIIRLPDPYRGCTMNFSDSPLTKHLKRFKLENLIGKDVLYTLDYCQTVCAESFLFRACQCLDELAADRLNDRFGSCDPCNADQSRCRRQFYRAFTTSSSGKRCRELCRPECNEIRYDITTSQSEWPNFRNQYEAITRFPIVNRRLEQSGVNWSLVADSDNDLNFIAGADEFRKNFLRVHVYIQEMNYLSVKDESSYLMSQLIADLGGCLGLYIGVSVISLMEFSEHFMRCFSFGCDRVVRPLAKKHRRALVARFLRRRTARRILTPTLVPPNRLELALTPSQPGDGENYTMLSRISRRHPRFFRQESNAGDPIPHGIAADDTASSDRKRFRVGPPAYPGFPSASHNMEGTSKYSRLKRGTREGSREPSRERSEPINPREWISRRNDGFQEIVQARQRLQKLARPIAANESLTHTVVNRT
ncbi:acid-sensing ion channel 1-like isoform X2 [Varroa destructor]|uniref:Uncharacterized protein n=1 Tax=Varroa destructor TaxID=109461 RepID=A0A7M7KCB4_VARDE|nr:acid-sensing ion channel 1-like isoform X2 [Varroa destructor]XP_022661928.1 acid-sensing ion channel 1-like isoform X2 [Varroa destructor]